jgi:hypothetical protein
VDQDPLSVDSKMRLSIVNKLTQEAYLNESDEVKAEVKRLRDEYKTKMQLEFTCLGNKSQIERSPQEYEMLAYSAIFKTYL